MNDDMRASAALAASIKRKHPGLPLALREIVAKANYSDWKEAWDACLVARQLPDHAAPAAASLGDGYMMAMGNVRAYQWPRGDVLTEDDFGEFFAAIERQAPAGGLDLPAPAELEPEPVGDPVSAADPEGWTEQLEALFRRVCFAPFAERRARFLGALKGHETMVENVEADDAADDAVRNTCRW